MGYWLKLYTDILEDPKYFRLSDNSKLAMYEIYLVAKKIEDGEITGNLPPVEDIAFYSRRPVEWWKQAFSELEKAEIVEIKGGTNKIRKYAERQNPVPDTERSKQYRKRKNHDNITKRDGDTETDTYTKSESETNTDAVAEVNPDNNNNDSLGDLTKIFIDLTHLEPEEKKMSEWVEAEMRLIKAGVTEDDLTMAVVEMQRKPEYKITSLKSIVTPAIQCQSKRAGREIARVN
jgi:hypothetical protein